MWRELAEIALVISLLVGVNGLYVAAEFAIIAVRPSRLAQLMEGGHPLAGGLLATVRSPATLDGYISTAQAGITMASLGLAMYGEAALATWIVERFPANWSEHSAHLVAGGLALAILTYVHIVAGEMIPKTWALSDPDRTALRAALPMQLSRILFWPLVAPLTVLGRAVLRLLRVPNPSTRERVLTADELGEVISQSTAGGLFSESEGQMLLNIIDFSERTARDVMTPRDRIVAVETELSGDEVVRRVEESPHTRMPVYTGSLDHPIGILDARDLVTRMLESGGSPTDWADLVRPAHTVNELMPLEDLLGLFRRERVRVAIAVSDSGTVTGLVTVRDVAEEIVGELP